MLKKEQDTSCSFFFIRQLSAIYYLLFTLQRYHTAFPTTVTEQLMLYMPVWQDIRIK